MKIRQNSLVQLIAAFLFIISSFLAVSCYPFLIVIAALAAFLPDILRVFGLLKDNDELHEAAASYAARIALAVLVLYAAVLFTNSDKGLLLPERQRDAWLIAFILAVTVRFIVHAIFYWDVRAAAPRIFLVFGGFWFLFSILSNWGSWLAMLIQASVSAGPLILCALFVRRHPYIIGTVSLGASIVLFMFINVYRLFLGNLGSLTVFILMVLPLLSVGTGLFIRYEEDEDEEKG